MPLSITRRHGSIVDSLLPVGFLASCCLPFGFPIGGWGRGETRSGHVFLLAIHIPLCHREHVHLTKEDVFYTRNLARLCATHAKLWNSATAHCLKVLESWKMESTKVKSGWGTAFFPMCSSLVTDTPFWKTLHLMWPERWINLLLLLPCHVPSRDLSRPAFRNTRHLYSGYN